MPDSRATEPVGMTVDRPFVDPVTGKEMSSSLEHLEGADRNFDNNCSRGSPWNS